MLASRIAQRRKSRLTSHSTSQFSNKLAKNLLQTKRKSLSEKSAIFNGRNSKRYIYFISQKNESHIDHRNLHWLSVSTET